MKSDTLNRQESIAGTADVPIESDDCGCTALMPCFAHFQNERGIPAVRRVREEAV